ncbi:MAG: molecular chaperone HtpG [Bacteriovoracaceae bacterium]
MSTERKGTISVETNDIFPIIKKWLYSEHDIFIRELVANATDAITKRATLSRTKNLEVPTGGISVRVNKSNKTLIIEDNGLGMTEAEVEKYLAQLAFSGAEEFIKKMEADGEKSTNDIIGKFGLGFYSAFMVSDKVEVESLSFEPGSKPVHWTCEGNPEYTFSESSKTEVGTKITLHINEESQDFLDEFKVSSTLRKFCDFMPYEIGVLDEEKKPEKPKKADGTVDEAAEPTPVTPTIINETNPLWRRDPKEITDDQYKELFRKLHPMDGDPLFWIHLNIDHPFNLQGILYFPKINPQRPFQERNIKLYNKQVFVSDNVKDIIPDFLSLLKGVIDSSDIPLNVSRSSLQGDPNIQKISNYIIKKVADALKVLFKKDRERYESIWDDIALFVKYGAISNTKFDETMRERILFSSSLEGKQTLAELLEKTPKEYEEKLKGTILYSEKDKVNGALKATLTKAGIPSVEADEHIDPHFFQHVEVHKVGEAEIKFRLLESEYGNIFKEESTSADDLKIKDLFSKHLGIETPTEEESKEAPAPSGDLDLEIENIQGSTAPAYFKVDEQMKRFQKMAQSMGNTPAAFPLKKTLVINPSNELVKNALKIHESGKNSELAKKLCLHVSDLAKISSEGLDNETKDQFIQRNQELISELSNFAL